MHKAPRTNHFATGGRRECGKLISARGGASAAFAAYSRSGGAH
jgi:hypothetical protein